MAADRTIATFGGCCVGDGHRFLAVHPLCPDHMHLVAGVDIMAGQAGDLVFICMQIVQTTETIPEAGFIGFLLGDQGPLMAFKAEILYRESQLEFEV